MRKVPERGPHKQPSEPSVLSCACPFQAGALMRTCVPSQITNETNRQITNRKYLIGKNGPEDREEYA